MNQTLKKFWLLFFLIAFGCAQTPEAPPKKTQTKLFESMHPEERHIWHPPSEEELEARRQRQKWLDVIAADLERLFMGYADILGDEIILENLLRGKDTELQQLEAKSGQQKIQDEERVRELNQVLQELESSVKEMDTSLEEVRKERAAEASKPKSEAQPDDYRLAILLFRNGQYLKSIAAFQRILKKKFAPRLKDNILFGLASNYYKLKQYDMALGHLDDIIRNHSRGDKWLVSHAMSGLIYNLQGNPDKAIPVLESALQHGPNEDLKKLINRLLKVAKGGRGNASS
jgi:tetratricopeptide (TPR) repeat protein